MCIRCMYLEMYRFSFGSIRHKIGLEFPQYTFARPPLLVLALETECHLGLDRSLQVGFMRVM